MLNRFNKAVEEWEKSHGNKNFHEKKDWQDKIGNWIFAGFWFSCGQVLFGIIVLVILSIFGASII